MPHMRPRVWGVFVATLALASHVVAAQLLSTYEQLLVAGTAVGITTTVTNPTGRAQMTRCEISVEGFPVRFRDDGTVPTYGTPPAAGSGTPLAVGGTLTVSSNEMARRIQFIRSASVGTALVNVRCYP